MQEPKRKALVRVINRMSPLHGEERGTYMQIAEPNQARVAFGKIRPAFDKPYKLEPDVLVTSQADINRVWPDWTAKYEITVLGD
jgi:hypothetical protein